MDMEENNPVMEVADIIQRFYQSVLDTAGKEKADYLRSLLICFIGIQVAQNFIKWLCSDEGKAHIKMLLANYHGGAGNG